MNVARPTEVKSAVTLSTMMDTAIRLVDLLDRAVPDSEKQAVNTVADGFSPISRAETAAILCCLGAPYEQSVGEPRGQKKKGNFLIL